MLHVLIVLFITVRGSYYTYEIVFHSENKVEYKGAIKHMIYLEYM